jgi:UDP-2,3-diacylglucosamine hydrolase
LTRQLFISDLHLEDSRPDISAALFEFLHHNLGKTDELFILGDLFEVWIGDDSSSGLSAAVSDALARFNSAGAAIYLMHGNRDFLLGESFAQSCGGALIQEPYVINTGVGQVLLMHGDILCTDDVDYQEFRQMVRSHSWQKNFLAQSLVQRQAFAKQARAKSAVETSAKVNGIMDVNAAAVAQALDSAGTALLLHGHTHRPAIHELAELSAKRVVLGDWDKRGWYAEIKGNDLALRKFEFGSLS